jgi:cytochrome c556
MRSLAKSRLIPLSVATICALSAVSAVHGQAAGGGPSPDQKSIEARQAAFKLISFNWEPIALMLRNQAKFDAALVQKNTARIEALGPMIPDLFVNDTRGKAAGVKTRAREGIWTSAADFKAKNDDFVKAMANLSSVAKSGDEKAFRTAAAAAGKTCGGCHDTFRDK